MSRHDISCYSINTPPYAHYLGPHTSPKGGFLIPLVQKQCHSNLILWVLYNFHFRFHLLWCLLLTIRLSPVLPSNFFLFGIVPAWYHERNHSPLFSPTSFNRRVVDERICWSGIVIFLSFHFCIVLEVLCTNKTAESNRVLQYLHNSLFIYSKTSVQVC